MDRLEKVVTLYIGGVHASEIPVLIKTLLGSCIAVCLFDPNRRIGGMNHFMLPQGRSDPDKGEATRFGVHAMDCLIGAMMKAGAERRCLIAKAFGGAHVLGINESATGVPQQNIAFVREFFGSEHIPVVSEDLGGYHPRELHFLTGTGQAFVRLLQSQRVRDRVIKREQREETRPPRYGSVTLFDLE
jgi:chemotaxis protein CheD